MTTTYTTLAQVAKANKAKGGHWFDFETLRFFGTTFETELYAGKYFVTGEDNFNRTATLYTVREVIGADIETVGEFQQYETVEEAIQAINELIGA